MYGAEASFVLGIDPSPLFMSQFQVLKHFLPELPIQLFPLKSEEMPSHCRVFDTVFSMGVLYHRRSPFDHLMELRSFLKPGGEVVMETLVIPGEENNVLVPENRYAKMRNVWFLPAVGELEKWLRRAGFKNVRTKDVNKTEVSEQRSTPWMKYESLADFLDPNRSELTIEGYPAPRRAIVIANAP